MAGSSSPRRSAGLTRERVLAAALELVDEAGADGLTMRRLGASLGVEAMSLYHHVAGREAVVDGIGELLMAQVAAPPPGVRWREACASFADSLRAITLSHPQAFRLIGLRPLATPAALAPVERLLDCLVAGGASPAAALTYYRAVASFARGYALAEVDGFTVEAHESTGRARLETLPTEAFPVLGGAVTELATVTPDSAWTAGLDALLDGLERALASPAA